MIDLNKYGHKWDYNIMEKECVECGNTILRGDDDSGYCPSSNYVNDMQDIARKLRRGFIGPIDLDNSRPIDIYELFGVVMGRDYDIHSHDDELLILEIANAYEGN